MIEKSWQFHKFNHAKQLFKVLIVKSLPSRKYEIFINTSVRPTAHLPLRNLYSGNKVLFAFCSVWSDNIHELFEDEIWLTVHATHQTYICLRQTPNELGSTVWTLNDEAIMSCANVSLVPTAFQHQYKQQERLDYFVSGPADTIMTPSSLTVRLQHIAVSIHWLECSAVDDVTVQNLTVGDRPIVHAVMTSNESIIGDVRSLYS